MIDIQDLHLENLTEEYHIPPKPEILVKLHGIMSDDSSDIRAIADLIAEDVGLSAEVIKTISSAYFGMRGQVSDIRQAAILLGPPGIANLVSAYELRRSLAMDTRISLQRFWECAADVAHACILIDHQLDLRIPSEDLYTTGLFHDCGIAIMVAKHANYLDVLREANSDYEHSMPQIESNYYKTDHTRIGYLLTRDWGLPEVICQAILQNHERDLWTSCNDNRLKQIVAVLKLAENMADRHRRQCENPDWPHHRDAVLRTLNIDDATCKALEQDFQGS